MSAMTFEALTKAVRNIVARCEYLEERAATANRGDIRGTASDRLRWGLLSHVAGVVAREYADQLALELSRIAEDAAASDTFDADGAAVEMVIHWARHCGRVVNEGVDTRRDLAEQLVGQATVEQCRKLLETLDWNSAHAGLSDEDMRAVFAARAAREAAQKAKPARAELVKHGGTYGVRVHDGNDETCATFTLLATRKTEAIKEAGARLTAHGMGRIPLRTATMHE